MAFLINNSWGADDVEKASVAFIVGNAAAGKGEARLFLTNAGTDIAIRDKAESMQADGYAPMQELVNGYLKKGGVLWVCKACADAKGIVQDDLIEGAELAGAGHTMGFLETGGQMLM